MKKSGGDRILVRAAGLAFVTVLALVPLTAMIYSFGGFSTFSERLVEGLTTVILPEGQQAVAETLSNFAENSRALGTWGTLLFLFTAVMLLNNVESHLNDIFRARPHRELVVRVGLYIAALVLISLLFGAGLGPLTRLTGTLSRRLPDTQAKYLETGLSTVVVAVGLFLLFRILASARISGKSSLIGAVFGAIALQGAKALFTLFASNSVSQSIIYGSLVFLPLLLMWTYVAWITVLFSAEIVYGIHFKSYQPRGPRWGSPAAEMDEGWRIFSTLVEAFRRGDTPMTAPDIASELEMEEVKTSRHIDALANAGLVHRIPGEPEGLILSRSPGTLPAIEVVEALGGWPSAETDSSAGSVPAVARAGGRDRLGGRNVASFLDADEPTRNPKG